MAAGKVHFTCQFGYFGLLIKNFLPVRFDIPLERDDSVFATSNVERKAFDVAGSPDLLAQIFKQTLFGIKIGLQSCVVIFPLAHLRSRTRQLSSKSLASCALFDRLIQHRIILANIECMVSYWIAMQRG